MSGLDLERAMISPMCLGIAERALTLSLEHAKARQQFGQPIGSVSDDSREARGHVRVDRDDAELHLPGAQARRRVEMAPAGEARFTSSVRRR